MTLDPNRWTLKATEAFSAATELGRSASHPEIVPEHLLLALLLSPWTLNLSVLTDCATHLYKLHK